MSSGVMYLNAGSRCLVRMAVSLLSLRQAAKYAGPVKICVAERMPAWFYGFIVQEVFPGGSYHVDIIQLNGANPRAFKASLWRHSEWDETLFIDSDTVILKDPTPLFADIKTHGFCVTQFSDWKSNGSKMSKRIKEWEPVVGKFAVESALAFGPAVNTGVFGWRKAHRFNKAWETLTKDGWNARCTKRMVDEIGCQLLLHKGVHIWPESWNRSVVYGLSDDPGILHLHGNKERGPYPMCKTWRHWYDELRRRYKDVPVE